MGNSIKKIPYLLATLLFACAALVLPAQQFELTNEAAKLCQDRQFAAALAKIDEAKKATTNLDEAYMWYVDGFIHKEIFKKDEINNRNSQHRVAAVQSFLRSLEVDKLNQHSAMTRLGLKYLASTYYNEALMQTQEFVLSNDKLPEASYAQFRKLMHYAEPGTSLKKFDNEFHKNMGQRYFALWQMDIENTLLADKAVDEYGFVVRADSTESDAWYNIAVVHYNRAVFKYRKIGPETDIFDLIVIQQECAELIKNKALPAMDKAYRLTPERGDVVRGLMYIHRALEHENDVEYFKAEIERLVREGKFVLPKE